MRRVDPLRPRQIPRIALLVAATLALLPGGLAGQESAGTESTTVLKRLVYVDASQAQQVLSMFDIAVRVQPDQNTVILTGPPNKIETAVDVLESLDVPSTTRNLTLTVSIIEAHAQGSNDLPDRLRPVAAQLGELLGYQAFTLLDTAFLRVSDRASADAAGGLSQGPLVDDDRRYELSIRRAEVFAGPDPSQPITIRLRDLGFSLYRLVDGKKDVLAGLRTHVEIEEGQTAVIGKATPAGGNGALVLVVRAEVL